MKGFSNIRPRLASLPVWSIDSAVAKLLTYYFKESTLYYLTRHLLFLMCIYSGRRVSDLVLLSAHPSHLLFTERGVTLQPLFGSKTDNEFRRSAPWKFITNPERRLSVPCLLRVYLHVTAAYRVSDHVLFRSTSQPGVPASLRQIQNYIRALMTHLDIAGTPGSTRSACATSALQKGVSIDEVMLRGGWAQSATLRKHYYRPAVE
jgi:integrase